MDYRPEAFWIGRRMNISTAHHRPLNDAEFLTAAASTQLTSLRDSSILCAATAFNLSQCRRPQRKSGHPAASKSCAFGRNEISTSLLASLLAAASFSYL